ncbi:MAG: hypothetical protein Q7K42_06160, partial [Candidatus Diapherotrites archaeon]|nr:hypothetical protein [Candidatus Diapherotrites archaeon]
ETEPEYQLMKAMERVRESNLPQDVKSYLDVFVRSHLGGNRGVPIFEINTYLREFNRTLKNPQTLEARNLDEFLGLAKQRKRIDAKNFLREKKRELEKRPKKGKNAKLLTKKIPNNRLRGKTLQDRIEKIRDSEIEEPVKAKIIAEIEKRHGTITDRGIHWIRIFFEGQRGTNIRNYKNTRAMSDSQRTSLLDEFKTNEVFSPQEQQFIIGEIKKREWLSEFDAHRIGHYVIGMRVVEQLKVARTTTQTTEGI